MIRITAVYPRQEGKRFNLDYYRSQHLPLVFKKLAPYGIIKYEVDIPIEKPGGGESPFFAVGYLYFQKIESFRKFFKEIGNDIVGDIPKYTNVTPMIQVGEITR